MSNVDSHPAAATTSGWRLEGIHAFGLIWIGQVVSLFGAHLASFVIGVWVFEETKSAGAFSLIFFFSVVPEILLSPIAGAVVDRWGRREAMLAGCCGAASCTAVLAFLANFAALKVTIIYVMVGLISAFDSVQFPALSSSITLLIPQRHLARANGMSELSTSLAMVSAPLVGATFLASFGLRRVLWFAVCGYAVALLTLSAIRIHSVAPSAQAGLQRQSILRDAVEGWRYVMARPELLALLFYFAVTNFTTGMVQVLLPPLVLSFASPLALGRIMSTGGIGLLLSSLLLSVHGGPKHRMTAILGVTFFQGALLFAGVLKPSVLLVGLTAFLFLFCNPITLTSSQTMWQKKVDPCFQGRAFAIRRLLAWSTMPFAYLAAGPLADHVFEPLMRAHGPLAGTVIANWIGLGPGRGIALLFVVLGVLTVMAAVAGYRYRPLRELEIRLPDISYKLQTAESR